MTMAYITEHKSVAERLLNYTFKFVTVFKFKLLVVFNSFF